MLAAYLDGTLSESERATVTREIARSPEAYAEFLEAQAIAALAAEASPASVETRAASEAGPRPALTSVPARAAVTRRAARFGAPALVVGIAAAAAFFLLRPAATAPVDLVVGRPAATVALAPLVERLGADWVDPAWPTVRGGADERSLPTRAFRLGARLVTLDQAARTGDEATIELVTQRIAALLREDEGGTALAALFESIAREGQLRDVSRRQQLVSAARTIGPREYFDLGSCVESERLGLIGTEPPADETGALVAACRAATTARVLDSAPAEWEPTLRDLRTLFGDRRSALDPPARAALVGSALANSPR
jgi:hypothetical protein